MIQKYNIDDFDISLDKDEFTESCDDNVDSVDISVTYKRVQA